MKRSCQRQITGLALPERRITSKVPRPSTVARMIWARAGNRHRLEAILRA
jgi:hypothetical protein